MFIIIYSMIFGFSLKMGYNKEEEKLYVNYTVNVEFLNKVINKINNISK